MKYVLWGMGQNGLELFDLMPKDDICAIIDRDKENYFLKKLGLDILRFDEYMTMRDSLPEHMIVICPFKYHSMENEIKKRSITNYSILKRSSVGMLAYVSLFDGTYIDRLMLSTKKHYFIFKRGLFQDLLFERMVIDGFKIDWVDDEINESFEIGEYYVNRVFYRDYTSMFEGLRNQIGRQKTIFIVACGPSLREEDLEVLYNNHCFSISVNDIYHVFDNTNWRPDIYFVSDRRQLKKYEVDKSYRSSVESIVKVFSDNHVSLMISEKYKSGTFFFRQIQDFENLEFSFDVNDGFYCSNTVVYGALQLAAYLGAETIYLIGCDNGLSNDKKMYFYDDDDLIEHFDDWKDKMNEAYCDMEIGYGIAKKVCEDNGIRIYNATRGGRLEIFDRVSFDKLFKCVD